MWEDEEASEITTSSCSVTYLSLLWRMPGKEKVSSTLRILGESSAGVEAPFITGTTTCKASAVPKKALSCKSFLLYCYEK